MQAGDELPWAVICRNIVDGIEAVIHQARTLEGERRVEQMVRVRDYDVQHNRWVVEQTWPPPKPAAASTSGASRTPPRSIKSSPAKRKRRRKR